MKALKSQGADKKTKKTTSKASGCSSSTAQYYHDTARAMGMVDGQLGVFMAGQVAEKTAEAASKEPASATEQPQSDQSSSHCLDKETELSLLRGALGLTPLASSLHQQMFAPYLFSLMAANKAGLPPFSSSLFEQSLIKPRTASAGSILLASPRDAANLNPLHCFVRRNVEVFAADETDVATPAPGRKQRIHIGQVGIRCIHCARLSPKDRVKRSVCYPPSVGGIYHAVSNMKFDHFAICRGLPPKERLEFSALRSSVGRNTGQNGPKVSSNSTAQYYRDSAVQLGLIDTDTGIHFGEPKNDKEAKEAVGISALMLAATDPSIRAAYAKSK